MRTDWISNVQTCNRNFSSSVSNLLGEDPGHQAGDLGGTPLLPECINGRALQFVHGPVSLLQLSHTHHQFQISSLSSLIKIVLLNQEKSEAPLGLPRMKSLKNSTLLPSYLTRRIAVESFLALAAPCQAIFPARVEGGELACGTHARHQRDVAG